MKTLHRVLCALILTVLSVSLCLGQSKKSYVFHGKVEAVNQKDKTLKVDGEKVDGWMGAMTMNYKVDDPSVISKLKPGDRITATVYDGDYVLHNVQAVGQDAGSKK